MKNTHNYVKLFFFGILVCLFITTTEEHQKSKSKITAKKENTKNTPVKIASTNPEKLYYYSDTNNKKYDYRISGKNENGEKVKGVINLESEIGIGVVKKENDAKEIEIISDHINSHRIIATDMNGFQYRLKLDDE